MARGCTIQCKSWNAIPLGQLSISTDGTSGAGGLEALVPLTVLRCRGDVQAQFDATVQVGDQGILTFALAIVSADAFALGASAFPDPASEPEFPWLWWGQIFLESISVAASAVNNTGWGPGAQRLELDTKAMRKMKLCETLAFVVQRTALAGAPVIEVVLGQTRVLLGT